MLKIAWSGVHVPRKGLPILLHALALIPRDVTVEAHLLSSGPETDRWKSSRNGSVSPTACVWHGRVPREEAVAVMASCDVFALTSLLDGTSCVLNEAIASGLPVVCHDACGFPDIVDFSCGVLVPLTTPAGSARAFADALASLAHDPQRYEQLAAGASRRATEITTAHRARQMLDVYERVLGRPIIADTSSAAPSRVAHAELAVAT
jgi:glycosyltransferase involved in cell wall biosynthesis